MSTWGLAGLIKILLSSKYEKVIRGLGNGLANQILELLFQFKLVHILARQLLSFLLYVFFYAKCCTSLLL
jgi:hypothetical protein